MSKPWRLFAICFFGLHVGATWFDESEEVVVFEDEDTSTTNESGSDEPTTSNQSESGATGCTTHEDCGLGKCVDAECYCGKGTYYNQDRGCLADPPGFAWYKSLTLLGCLLLLGKALRILVRPLQLLFFPAAIIAGLVFFFILQIYSLIDHEGQEEFVRLWTIGWANIGPFAIDVLFASLFLGTPLPTVQQIVDKAGPQLMFNQVCNWGLWSTAIAAVGLICVPLFGSDPLMASLIPAGFTGGHAIAYALQESFEEKGFHDGLGLGLYVSTLGMLASFLCGVVWITIADKRGMLIARKSADDMANAEEADLFAKGLFARDAMPSAGLLTVTPDSIDVISLHVAVVLAAMLIGITISELVEPYFDLQRFLCCMAVGIFFQYIYEKLVDRRLIPPMLDPVIMTRIQGLVLDFLIVAAMSTVDIRSIMHQLIPVTIACVLSVAFLGICVWYIAPIILPNFWFERAICEYGQTTGVISSGLILLKMCDPDGTLPVMESFALKNFAAMPIMFTALPFAVDWIYRFGLLAVFAMTFSLCMAYGALYYFYYRPKYLAQSGGHGEMSADVGEALGPEVSVRRSKMEMATSYSRMTSHGFL